MRSKALMIVVAGFIILASMARAESPASLTESAPFCRSLVKARFTERDANILKFQVERIYLPRPQRWEKGCR